MNAATHYPMLAAQAEASIIAATPCSTVEAERGRVAFLRNIQSGCDKPMPHGYNTHQYAVSTYLGECDRSAQAMLFAACSAALAGRSTEEVTSRLQAFVHAVAREYGEDSADAWEAA